MIRGDEGSFSATTFSNVACLIMAVAIMLPGDAFAQGELENGRPLEALNEEVVIENVIIDHGLTFRGHQFYSAFAKAMAEQESPAKFDHLVVEERPYANSGSLVSVEQSHRKIYQVVIYAGPSRIEAMGKMAAAYVNSRLYNQRFDELLFKDPDLAGDEL